MKVTKIFINEGKENYSHFKGDTGKLVNKDTELNEVKIKKYISDVNKDRIAIKKYISNVSKEKEKHIRCCKKRKITKSLINNKAYFKVKNNKIELIAKSNESLSRTEWLMSFSNWNNNCINKQLIKKEAFEYYEKFYFINNDIEFIKDLNQKNLFCVYKNTINEYEKNALKKYLKDNKIDLKENITKNYVFLITKYLKANNEEREKNKKLKNIKESEKEVLKNIDKEKVIEDLENYFYYMTEVRDYMDKIFTKGRIHKLNSNDCINKIDNIKKSIRNHIRGKVVNKIILQGKILAYYGNEEEKLITTKELEEIKIKESIKKQFINSVYFANSKLANLINYTGDKDVVEKEYLREEEYKNLEDNVKKRYIAIKNFNEIKKRLQEIYNIDVDNIDNIYYIITYLKCTVNYTRNKSVHVYERVKDEHGKSVDEYISRLDLNNIFGLSNNFKEKGKEQEEEKIKSCENTFLQAMNYDFNELNNNYKRKIESMGLLECYSTDNLNEILSKIELSLSYSNIPFRPAFKKVYKKGVNIQSAKNNNLINYNNGFYKEFSNVQATLENQKKLKKKNIAYKNLLQLIYNNSFFNYLNKEEGEELLKESIIKVINSNLDINYQKESKNKKVEKEDIKEYKYSKFNDLIKDDFRSEEFFKKVQRLIMIDEDDKNNKNNKNDKSKKSKKSDKNKYSGLMQDIFVYSFNEYLNKYYTLNQNKKINIMPEEISSYDINKLNVNVKTKIEKQEKLIQSYIYFKLLNNDILSELKNNLIKIQIYEKDKVNRTELDEKIKLIDNYIELINIVILTNSMNDFSNEKGIEDELRKNYIKILKGFVEEKFFSNKCINKNNGENCAISTCDIDCNKKVYFTENGIKSLKNLIKLNKKGISSAYSEMYKNKKVTMTDIENFKNCQKNIVENQNKAEELHKKLVKYKNRKGNEEKYNELYEEYKSVLSNVKEYNKYKAIVMLNDISNINKLNIEIISRLNGFWTDLERDVQFIRKYAYCIEEFDNHDNGIWLNNYEDVRDYSKKNKKKFIQGKINNIEKQICGFEYKGVTKNIRNHIAHFEQYRNPKYSLMELINHTFEEMKYDSKRRNAVTKSIIDLCERHGLLIDFKLDSGEYSINFIKSKEINYLGKKTNYGNTPIKQPLYDERYLEMVKVLFEYKNK